MNPTQHIYPTGEEVAAAFARTLKSLVDHSAGDFHIALSGGSTPKILFSLLAAEYADKLAWERIHFWWGDERCVPPDHDDSNYKMTKERLIDHVAIPEVNVHRVLGENDPKGEAERYAKEIRQCIPMQNGWPVFDMMLLGMGGDGHTASIFPDNLKLLESDQICDIAVHPESGQIRVTLTGHAINQSRHIAFLVTGASKTEKVREIFKKEGNFVAYPAAHISPVEGHLSWYMDQAAAADL